MQGRLWYIFTNSGVGATKWLILKNFVYISTFEKHLTFDTGLAKSIAYQALLKTKPSFSGI